MSDINLEECHKSLAELIRLRDDSKSRPESPKVMNLISHMDVRNICLLFEQAKINAESLVLLNEKLVYGIMAAIDVANTGGKREDVINVLRSTLKSNGYNL